MPIDIGDERWYSGLTLLERQRVMPHGDSFEVGRGRDAREGPAACGVAAAEDHTSLVDGSTASDRESAGTGRFERWGESGPFSRPGLFARRLAADGLTAARFEGIIRTEVAQLRGLVPVVPEWLRELAAAFGRTSASDLPSFLAQGTHERAGGVELMRIVGPLVARGVAEFRGGLAALLARHPDAPVSIEDGERLFVEGLAPQMVALVGRTVVLELHLARLKGDLRGGTAGARFDNFVTELRETRGAIALLREYPVLPRVVLEAVRARVDARLAFVRHLCEDWPAIVARWPALANRRLERIACAPGDPHRGVRRVLRVTFGGGRALMYKPRSLQVDVHFQMLLAWLNARGEAPVQRTLAVLDRSDRGWMEVVEVAPCETYGQAARFYERLGGYVALLHALEATDCCREQFVASGEHPVLIDLEALFRPHTYAPPRRFLSSASSDVASMAAVPMPVAMLTGAAQTGVPPSAQVSAMQMVATWGDPAADQTRSTQHHGMAPVAAGVPTLYGRAAAPFEHALAFERGFVKTYRTLHQCRTELLADDGLVGRFGGDSVRVSLRPVEIYDVLLQDSTHPDVLRDGLDRDRLFDWLWADVDRQSDLARVIAAERHDLERGEMPRFTTIPSSCGIQTSTGAVVADYFDVPGLERVKRRLRMMGEEDLERQRGYLRASLAACRPVESPLERLMVRTAETRLGRAMERLTERMAEGAAGGNGECVVVNGAARDLVLPRGVADAARATEVAGASVRPELFLDAAARVAHRLRALAFVDARRATWVGLTMVSGERWSPEPLGLDLQGGLPGVALFLARLARVTGDEGHRRLATQAVETIMEELEELAEIEGRRGWPVIGAFRGWGGVLYALAHVGWLLEDERCFERAETLVPRIAGLVEADHALDLVSGSAGAIMSLAAWQAIRPSDHALEVIRACAAHLVRRAEAQPTGWGWRTSVPASQPLVGMAHGAAGVALALFQASALTGDAAARDAASLAIDYERSVFVPGSRNWPDFRLSVSASSAPCGGERALVGSSGRAYFMTAWCHGAVGVGLARLAGLPYHDEWRVRLEVTHAVKTTMQEGFEGSHCLCHGGLGNVELLVTAAGRMRDRALRQEVDRIAAGILRDIDVNGWRCGVPLRVETPGLMAGLAGIGDGLLRLAVPDLPSLLVLAPPVSPPGRGAAKAQARGRGADTQEEPDEDSERDEDSDEQAEEPDLPWSPGIGPGEPEQGDGLRARASGG